MKATSRVEQNKNRRRNAKLYPIYKMFSWDLLCYYSIEYLFLTMTKGITVSQVLLISAFYLAFKMLVQIQSVTICDFLGCKKSMILGNFILVIHIIILIFAPSFGYIILSNFFCGLGYAIKNIVEGNLLYDSVATRGGDGLYSKIDRKGRKPILHSRWNFSFNRRLFICNKQLFTNDYLPCLFNHIYNIIIWF